MNQNQIKEALNSIATEVSRLKVATVLVEPTGAYGNAIVKASYQTTAGPVTEAHRISSSPDPDTAPAAATIALLPLGQLSITITPGNPDLLPATRAFTEDELVQNPEQIWQPTIVGPPVTVGTLELNFQGAYGNGRIELTNETGVITGWNIDVTETTRIVSISGVNAGTYDLAFMLFSGYQPLELTGVQITAGDTTMIPVTLERVPSEVTAREYLAAWPDTTAPWGFINDPQLKSRNDGTRHLLFFQQGESLQPYPGGFGSHVSPFGVEGDDGITGYDGWDYHRWNPQSYHPDEWARNLVQLELSREARVVLLMRQLPGLSPSDIPLWMRELNATVTVAEANRYPTLAIDLGVHGPGRLELGGTCDPGTTDPTDYRNSSRRYSQNPYMILLGKPDGSPVDRPWEGQHPNRPVDAPPLQPRQYIPDVYAWLRTAYIGRYWLNPIEGEVEARFGHREAEPELLLHGHLHGSYGQALFKAWGDTGRPALTGRVFHPFESVDPALGLNTSYNHAGNKEFIFTLPRLGGGRVQFWITFQLGTGSYHQAWRRRFRRTTLSICDPDTGQLLLHRNVMADTGFWKVINSQEGGKEWYNPSLPPDELGHTNDNLRLRNATGATPEWLFDLLETAAVSRTGVWGHHGYSTIYLSLQRFIGGLRMYFPVNMTDPQIRPDVDIINGRPTMTEASIQRPGAREGDGTGRWGVFRHPAGDHMGGPAYDLALEERQWKDLGFLDEGDSLADALRDTGGVSYVNRAIYGPDGQLLEPTASSASLTPQRGMFENFTHPDVIEDGGIFLDMTKVIGAAGPRLVVEDAFNAEYIERDADTEAVPKRNRFAVPGWN